jgi:beta-lactamase superfamily II metal-dependent hydrolase
MVKSFAVGDGDTYYIAHGSDSLTIIDCCLNEDRKEEIVDELVNEASEKGLSRFISTHPDDDHIRGLKYLNGRLPIQNFYCVKNKATKPEMTPSFQEYCSLRDGDKACFTYAGLTRKWLNDNDEARGSAGLSILWPKTSNASFKAALSDAAEGKSYNNISSVIRYATGNKSFLWLGDLETGFMEAVEDDISLKKTDVVFAAHHGRFSGKIPDSWLDIIQPKIIVIGEAPSRHLHYYSGYNTITQNKAGDIIFRKDGSDLDIFVSERDYGFRAYLLNKEKQLDGMHYIGTLA